MPSGDVAPRAKKTANLAGRMAMVDADTDAGEGDRTCSTRSALDRVHLAILRYGDPVGSDPPATRGALLRAVNVGSWSLRGKRRITDRTGAYLRGRRNLLLRLTGTAD